MPYNPFWRKAALLAHVTASIGWLGSVVAFLAVALTALAADESRAAAASTTMALIGWFVIVPFSAASLLSGILQSIGTTWGLFRHYWVIAKLVISVGASLLLVLHMRVVDSIAMAASHGSVQPGHMEGPKMQVVADSGAAIVVLLIAATLSIYKPRGRTDEPAPRWVKVSGVLVALALGVVIVRHLSTGIHSTH